MADSTKYMPINGGTLLSDLKFKKLFSFGAKRTRAFALAFISVFVAVSVFLVCNPSTDPSSPWFSSIFNATAMNAPGNGTSIQANGTSSSVSSLYSYFFPSNSSQESGNSTFSGSRSVNLGPPEGREDRPVAQNRTRSQDSGETVGVLNLKANQTSVRSHEKTAETAPKPQSVAQKNATGNDPKSTPDTLKQHQIGSQSGSNKTAEIAPKPIPVAQKNATGNEPKSTPDTLKQYQIGSQSGSNKTAETVPKQPSVAQKNATGNEPRSTPDTLEWAPSTNQVHSAMKNGTHGGQSLTFASGSEDFVKGLVNCDLFDGEWVRDESYPLYEPGSCSLIDEQFNCVNNGRRDRAFQMLKWKPKGCTLPRLDGRRMLWLLRGKRLVFVGDSLNRNMWESLVCILRSSVVDQTKVYEVSGHQHFRSEASYSFVFKDYNCTIEFFVAPFLVQEWETKDKNGTKKETLRIDLMSSSAYLYKDADVFVFNTGHWWTHDKTAKGQDYYQEGNHVYSELNVLDAFRKAMTTWGRWVDANINPTATSVFFRGYSASHFSGGQWNSGGACDHETEPIRNATYLTPYPDKMTALEAVLGGMKTRVSYLNVTRLTDFRKDGHPSVYRKRRYTPEELAAPLRFQDCSHWCLPGVPDAWNEILYAELLAKQYQDQQQKH